MSPVGKELYETRKRQGKTLLEVEKATKIPSKYIQALENEQFELLPGGVYTKGFIRIYANYLGLDPYPLVEEYKRTYEKLPSYKEPKVSPLTPSPSQTRHRLILMLIFVLILVIVLAFLAWLGSAIRW